MIQGFQAANIGGRWDTAEICLNGHVTTSFADTQPDARRAYCEKCGSKTIVACPECSEKIRSNYYGDPSYPMSAIPRYCHACGKAYPWTDSALRAAQEYAEEIDGLSPDDRELLKKSLVSMTSDGPDTNLAVSRFKRLAVKVGKAALDELRKFAAAIATEYVKKELGL